MHVHLRIVQACCTLFAVLLLAVGTHRAAAISLGQVDAFEGATTDGWQIGRTLPGIPQRTDSGGNPGGFLETRSTGAGAAGSMLVVFNQAQWSGNYLDAGIADIEMDLRNIGGVQPLPIRIAIQGAGNTQFGSADAFSVPADDQWHKATFGLSAADLSLITGGAGLNTVLADVQTLRILSAAGGPDWRGDRIAAQLGIDNITAIGASPELRAGDADQDLDFDQFDLIRVQQAAKYLTGQPATWGEGDWDGAPGGQPGDPPPGDGLFNQFDIIAAQQAAIYLTGSYAAVRSGGQLNDAQTSVVYRATTGEILIDAPAGTELTSVNIESASGIFTGDPAQQLGGSFDNDADANIFKATFGSTFGSLSFGHVARPGLEESFLLDDLTVVGSLAGGGGLGDVDLVYIPEPSAVALLLFGCGMLAAHRQYRRDCKGKTTSRADGFR